jgi:hypothetical protein
MLTVPMSKLPVLSEDEEQIAFVEYLEVRSADGIKFTAVPNNTYTPHMSQKIKNKKLGLRPGMSDLIVAIPHVGLACPEMKKTKGGVQSEHQKQWEAVLNTVPGVEYRICAGAIEAIRFIEELSPSAYGAALLSDRTVF